MDELMIRIDNVSKQYRLGAIGGGTLQRDLQSWWALKRGKEDPNSKIGAKQYGKNEKFLALDGVSFEVKKGERVGIIGHNGAGKSTLLKLLSRVTAPTTGEINLNGRVASMLEVGTGFHGELTGRENIYMNGAILGMSKKEIDAKMEDIIEFSECRQFIDTPVKRYSSGMYVKLAFSVAAHLDSEIMIMDEVLAVGDMKFQQKCLGKMDDVSKGEGRTILYVSHNMNTIRRLCTRCIVLSHGKIIFDGEVEKAISIYMDDKTNDMGVNIDLSKSRMPHLPFNISAKIMSVKLINKTNTNYELGDTIKFSVSIQAMCNILKPCLRAEIRTENDSPVGAEYINNLPALINGKTNVYNLEMHSQNLAPGRYKVLLVLYEVNEYGTFEDIDAVWPGFIFSIIDNNHKISIEWRTYKWGSIYMGEFAKLDKQ